MCPSQQSRSPSSQGRLTLIMANPDQVFSVKQWRIHWKQGTRCSFMVLSWTVLIIFVEIQSESRSSLWTKQRKARVEKPLGVTRSIHIGRWVTFQHFQLRFYAKTKYQKIVSIYEETAWCRLKCKVKKWVSECQRIVTFSFVIQILPTFLHKHVKGICDLADSLKLVLETFGTDSVRQIDQEVKLH